MKNKPSLKELKEDYRQALEYHDEYIAKIEEWEELAEGGRLPKVAKGRSKIRPKLIRKQAEWRYPSLEEPFLNTKDMFKINPRSFEDTASAEQNEVVLNYQWATQIDKVEFVNDVVRCLVDYGSAIVKVGWDLEEDIIEVEKEVDVIAGPEESIRIIKEAVKRGKITQREAELKIQNLEPVVIGKKKEVFNDIVTIKNQPKYEVCDLRDVIIDPTVNNVKEAKFIIHRFESSFADLKAYEKQIVELEDGSKQSVGLYSNIDKIEKTLRDEAASKAADIYEYDDVEKKSDVDFKFEDIARKKLEVIEYWGYWDFEDDGILRPFVATWVGDVMIRLEESPYPFKGLPFAMAKYMPRFNELYGEPDAELLKENQDSIGKMMRAVHDITAQIAVNQKFIDEQFFSTPLQRKNYEEGKTVYFRHGIDPRVGIHKESVEPVPASAFQVIQYHQNDAEAMTGIKSFSQGIGSQSMGSSATAIRSALDATAKRELSILRRLATQIFEDIARKTIAMNQMFLDDEMVVRLTNKQFITVRKEELKGEFDLTVEVSTPEKDNEKAEKLNMLMQTNAANMDPNLAKIIYAKIARLWKEPDLAEEMLNYQPEPDPVQQELQKIQLENAMLINQKTKMEIAKLAKEIESEDSKIEERESRIAKHLNSEAEEFKAEAMLKKAKAAEVAEKARLMKIEADRKLAGLDIKTELSKDALKIKSKEREIELKMKHQAELEALKAQLAAQQKELDAVLKMIDEKEPELPKPTLAEAQNYENSLESLKRAEILKGDVNGRI